VTFGGEPIPVDDQLIEDIESRIKSRGAEPALRAGDRVEICQGPFRGLDAIFETHQGEQRALLLIAMLNRQVRIKIPLADIRRSA
jgi:transcriptional antiterminator RfaH